MSGAKWTRCDVDVKINLLTTPVIQDFSTTKITFIYHSNEVSTLTVITSGILIPNRTTNPLLISLVESSEIIYSNV